jgi:hypothetical protein
MTALLALLLLMLPFLAAAVILPHLVAQEKAKIEAFLLTLAQRGPMTADEIVAAAGTMSLLRRYMVDALEEAADAGRIERRAPFPGQRGVRYAARKLRPPISMEDTPAPETPRSADLARRLGNRDARRT